MGKVIAKRHQNALLPGHKTHYPKKQCYTYKYGSVKDYDNAIVGMCNAKTKASADEVKLSPA